jgi:GH15 family glucan-1,4-alpha-glucosidase
VTPDDRDRLSALAAQSVMTILASQAPTGAYPAAPSFEPYRFCWLRDGSFIADAVSRAGEVASAEAFFEWCAGVLRARRSVIEELVERRSQGEEIGLSEHPHSRFTPEGDDSAVEWSNHQLDGYGSWMWALAEHAGRHGRDVSRFADAVELSARYVVAFADDPCFDWWEERAGLHTVTLAAAAAGLRAAAGIDGVAPDARESSLAGAQSATVSIRRDGARGGRLNAALGDDRLDASLLACAVPFGILAADDPLVLATVEALEGELVHGGVHRHAEDTYYGGGEWLLLAALLGGYYAAAGREEEARAQLAWVADRAEPNGDLPEQTDEHLLAPGAREEWVRRWGPPASPLLWSHAFYLALAIRLGLPIHQSVAV